MRVRRDLKVIGEHSYLIGKIAKLTTLGVLLEKKYEELFGVGNAHKAEFINYYCYIGGRYEMSLIFIDEPPEKRGGIMFYWLEEIGVGVMGDWHLYTLEQLMICN